MQLICFPSLRTGDTPFGINTTLSQATSVHIFQPVNTPRGGAVQSLSDQLYTSQPVAHTGGESNSKVTLDFLEVKKLKQLMANCCLLMGFNTLSSQQQLLLQVIKNVSQFT